MSWYRAFRASPLRVPLETFDPSSETPRQAHLPCRSELRCDRRACWGYVSQDERTRMMSVCRWLASRQTRRGHRPGKNAERPSEKNSGCRFGRCGAHHRRNPPAPVQEAPMSAKRWNRRGGGAAMRYLSFQPPRCARRWSGSKRRRNEIAREPNVGSSDLSASPSVGMRPEKEPWDALCVPPVVLRACGRCSCGRGRDR
jgi:hypothetical protein